MIYKLYFGALWVFNHLFSDPHFFFLSYKMQTMPHSILYTVANTWFTTNFVWNKHNAIINGHAQKIMPKLSAMCLHSLLLILESWEYAQDIKSQSRIPSQWLQTLPFNYCYSNPYGKGKINCLLIPLKLSVYSICILFGHSKSQSPKLLEQR